MELSSPIAEWPLNHENGDNFTVLQCLLPVFPVEGLEHHFDPANQRNILELIAYGTHGAFGVLSLVDKAGILEIVPIYDQLCGSKVLALAWSLDSRFHLDLEGHIHLESL
jgi:hypothetical protein